MKYLVLSPLALALAATPTFAETRIPYDDPVAVETGQRIYGEQCASCHGAKMEGEPNWQFAKDNGLRAAPPHDETGHTWHHADAQLFDLTKNGLTAVMARQGMSYESDMIGYADILTDEEILATLAYIKSTWPKRVIEMHNKVNASQ